MKAIRSAVVTISTLYALMIRDMLMTTRGKPLGVLSYFAEPLAMMTIMTFVFSYVKIRGVDLGEYLTLFFMTAIIPLFLWKNCMMRLFPIMRRQRTTLYHPLINPIDLALMHGMTQFIVYFVLFMVVNWFFVLVYDYVGGQYTALVFIPLACNTLIGLGMGMVIFAIAEVFPYIRTIVPMFILPIMITSGKFYTAETVNPRLLEIVEWNPFFHSTELIRTFYYYEYTSPIFSPTYYFGWTIVCAFLFFGLERLMRPRIMTMAA